LGIPNLKADEPVDLGGNLGPWELASILPFSLETLQGNSQRR
jgi:hypothetical protein